MPFADHNAILDPTCSDLTARTLELLGYIGFDPQDASRARRDSIFDRHAGRGRFVVRPLGRELHLRHLAGAARPARHRRRHDAGLDSARTRLARELSERRRRLGRNLRAPTKIRRPKASAKAPRRKRRGRSWAFARAAISIARAFNAVCVSCSVRRRPTARGTNRKSPAPVSRDVFYLKYDMYRQNFPLLALATYVNYRSGLGTSSQFLSQRSLERGRPTDCLRFWIARKIKPVAQRNAI